MNENELRRFLMSFYRWHEQAEGNAQRCSRTRMLFLCLLMRFTGMRPGEAFSFNDEKDLDAAKGEAVVGGRCSRAIPLSPRSMKKLEELRGSPFVLREKGRLCRMDQGYVRRVFEARGRDAGLPFRANPSMLRRAREEELLRMGMSQEAAAWILGRGGKPDAALLQEARRKILIWEREQGIGRHNCFQGEVQDITRTRWCARITLRTESGLLLRILCTARTEARLGLAPGARVAASFRTMHGRIGQMNGAGNSIPCRVTELYQDGGDLKVMLELSSGDRCCIIAAGGAERHQGLRPGDRVWLNIDEADFNLFFSEDISLSH